MPHIQLFLTDKANANAVHWKTYQGFLNKEKAINDLLEKTDLEALSALHTPKRRKQ